MAKDVIGAFDLDIECPKCKRSFKTTSKSVGKSVNCPYCKQQIDLVDDGFSKGIKSVNKQISDMFKNLKF